LKGFITITKAFQTKYNTEVIYTLGCREPITENKRAKMAQNRSPDSENSSEQLLTSILTKFDDSSVKNVTTIVLTRFFPIFGKCELGLTHIRT
jgi:hypothetical protein